MCGVCIWTDGSWRTAAVGWVGGFSILSRTSQIGIFRVWCPEAAVEVVRSSSSSFNKWHNQKAGEFDERRLRTRRTPMRLIVCRCPIIHSDEPAALSWRGHWRRTEPDKSWAAREAEWAATQHKEHMLTIAATEKRLVWLKPGLWVVCYPTQRVESDVAFIQAHVEVLSDLNPCPVDFNMGFK